MKALGGIDRNRPEFCRSLRITPAISAPTLSPLKSTIAIGTGSKLGLVMSMVSWACAGAATRGSQRNATQNRLPSGEHHVEPRVHERVGLYSATSDQ